MDGLTAKVFRTYNASVTLEKELTFPEKDIDVNATLDEKLYFYNKYGFLPTELELILFCF
jgi:hypothetical protein